MPGHLLEMGEDETKGSETTSTEKAHEGDAASSGSRASMCVLHCWISIHEHFCIEQQKDSE